MDSQQSVMTSMIKDVIERVEALPVPHVQLDNYETIYSKLVQRLRRLISLNVKSMDTVVFLFTNILSQHVQIDTQARHPLISNEEAASLWRSDTDRIAVSDLTKEIKIAYPWLLQLKQDEEAVRKFGFHVVEGSLGIVDYNLQTSRYGLLIHIARILHNQHKFVIPSLGTTSDIQRRSLQAYNPAFDTDQLSFARINQIFSPYLVHNFHFDSPNWIIEFQDDTSAQLLLHSTSNDLARSNLSGWTIAATTKDLNDLLRSKQIAYFKKRSELCGSLLRSANVQSEKLSQQLVWVQSQRDTNLLLPPADMGILEVLLSKQKRHWGAQVKFYSELQSAIHEDGPDTLRLKAKEKELLERERLLEEKMAAFEAAQKAAPARIIKKKRVATKKPSMAPPPVKPPTPAETPAFELTEAETAAVVKLQGIIRQSRSRKAFHRFIRFLISDKCKAVNVGRYRNKAFREILSTEQFYVEGLLIMKLVYVERLQALVRVGRPVVEKEQFSAMFAGFDEVLTINLDFLKDLEGRFQKWPRVTQISDIFLKWGPLMKRYDTYVKNFESSRDAVKLALESASFLKWMEMLPPNKYPPLGSLLIRPVQRLPRYRMLLQELIRHTPENHIDFKGLTQALGTMKVVVESVEKEKDLSENMKKLYEISNQITGRPTGHLVDISRTFITGGVVAEILDVKKQFHAFLFSDVLVVCGLEKRGKYAFKSEIALRVGWILKGISDAAAVGVRNAFQVMGTIGGKQAGFCLATPQEKAAWFAAVDAWRSTLAQDPGQATDMADAPVSQTDSRVMKVLKQSAAVTE